MGKKSFSSLAQPSIEELWELMLRGSYPELIESPNKDSSLWHASYVQTYLERDVRAVKQVSDLTQFQLFLRAVFETFVVSQIYKRLLNRGMEPSIYFWRIATGVEIDLLVEEQGIIHPIEVKATATPRPTMASSLSSLHKTLGSKTSTGYVVHMGDLVLPLAPNVEAIPLIQL